ncbi:MAG: radical SAM protein [Chloroflexi bacterium]|nr:radical SAM protein [Chloroflexota bacterium]
MRRSSILVSGSSETSPEIKANLGSRRVAPLRAASFPDAGAAVSTLTSSVRPPGSVDVMLVNPPSPDGGIWIRSQHRVGRRSRENMIWPQVSLAQLAALLVPDYTVAVVDAITTRMSWEAFEQLLDEKQPKYYLTQVTAPTLRNDLRGVFVAKAVGAQTLAFGTHVTPMTLETMRPFPALDYVLRGEPEATLRELLDVLEGRVPVDDRVEKIVRDTRGRRSERRPELVEGVGDQRSEVGGRRSSADVGLLTSDISPLTSVRGLAWRRGEEIVINPDRAFVPELDDLPMPLHELLPLDQQRMPMLKGPFTFIVTSRGCPAGCTYCIKHVSYQNSVRLRSPQLIVEELQILSDMGIHNVHMYADLFTVNREQVMALCEGILDAKLTVHWTCNSRVDYVDEAMLKLMGRAGCHLISWGIESANEQILKRARKGYRKAQAALALTWAHEAGVKNWGYFIIGLPGESEESIQETIVYSKTLPLDIALFHIAAPYPGTPFFFEVVENGWFRPDTRWEEVDMDQSTVLDYGNLTAEQLIYWQKRATREWSFRPGPMWTFLKSMNSWAGFKSAVNVGWQTLKFVGG